MNKNDTEYEKTWKLLQELIEAGKETDKRMKETDKKIDKLQTLIGGIGNSNGFVAEDLLNQQPCLQQNN